MGPPSRSEEGGREEFIDGIGTRGDPTDGRDLLLLSSTATGGCSSPGDVLCCSTVL